MQQKKNRLIPSPALGVALLALVLAMSGAAIALPGKASVKKDDLAKGAVTAKAIAKNAVKTKHVKNGAITGAKVKDGSLTSADVADGSLSSRDIGDHALISSTAGNYVRLAATEAGSEAAARAAAPATTLFQKGGLTITGKCFRDTVGDTTYAEMYVATNADGALLDGDTDSLTGGPAATDFLNVATPELDRQLDIESQTGASADIDEGEFTIIGADGTHLIGQNMIGAKNGSLPGGNGIYGPGNVCLFGGHIVG
jgi:hypothetical protein